MMNDIIRLFFQRAERSQSVDASELKEQQQRNLELTMKPGYFDTLKEQQEEEQKKVKYLLEFGNIVYLLYSGTSNLQQ